MSKMTNAVKVERNATTKKAVVNFMGGISYEVNPLDTLKMVTASSIFGEPQYYRDGEFAQATMRDGKLWIDPLFMDYSILDPSYKGKHTSEIMEEVIDKALDYDFEATIRWAVTLRKEYYMRLNPQVIMVRAAMHPARVAFNQKNPGVFATLNAKVMARADEPASQLTYYLYRNGSKNNVPNVLKRSWAKKIESLDTYAMHKYKNSGIGLIDVVRVCHANNDKINELMKTGTLAVEDSENTWESLRAGGKSWREILDTIKLNHMALLRNLRGIFKEIEDVELCKNLLAQLKAGVPAGKQFPFRYYSALQAVKGDSAVNHKPLIIDALEECIDIACDNMPKLKGKTMCLSDNSGSAWGTCTSEYGSVRIAEIDNLSSVITAHNSEEGYVGKFGDKLIVTPISKRNGVLAQTEEITSGRSSDVGGATENGVWVFFKQAIEKKEHWDNIFIYSDQQAGHGGLYGTLESEKEYSKKGFGTSSGPYVDVAKLINAYRQQVNPNVNVFSVQTAGYTNVVIPEYGYRTNLLYGWTGKELSFADTMIKFWDEKDALKHPAKE